MPKEKRKSYPAFIKLDAINYAKQTSNHAAARMFSVNHTQISRWRKKEEKLKKAKQTNCRIGSGIGVTPSDVKSNMKRLLNTEFRQIYSNAIYKFQAADTWFYRFINRSDFSLRKPNVDEIPIFFDMVGALTLDYRADKSKLPPMVIFKKKRKPKGQYPPGLIIRMQSKGWMDEELMKDWIESVWLRRAETWNNISPEIISKSFKKCGISNALDGSENGLIGINEENNDEHFVVLNNENENESIKT
ncbi:23121_t:CDS:2, partial [Cetraspora pellucida]